MSPVLLAILLAVASSTQSQRVKFKQVLANLDEQTFAIQNESVINQTKILIGIKIRDHSYSLPTFLATLETLKCPSASKKCDLWVVFDRCNDISYEMFTEWLSNTREMFDTIIMIDTKNDEITRQKHPELDPLYFSPNLKIRAIKYALDRDFNFIFFLNADNILINPNTIEILIKKQKTIVAPLLTSSETRYSTFWTKNDQKFDDDDERYFSIYNRDKLGCFKVLGVQETFLMNLNDPRLRKILVNEKEPDELFEDYSDDMWLNHNANSLNILAYVCNREIFGYIPDTTFDSYDDQVESFVHLRIEHLLKGPNKTYNEPLAITKYIEKNTFKKRKTKMGFDQIYVVNLERREDRRKRIEATLDDLNLSYKMTKAVDGKKIDEEYLKSLGIQVIPDYKDPYSDRSINYGEIGCFLSHYFIWKDMVENNYEKIIILEDDARFLLNFKSNLNYFVNTMMNKGVEWDLLYLGRKIMKDYAHDESWNRRIPYKNGRGIVKPSYTHWTVAYALTLEGAKKLLDSEPLKKILPVDEFLPIMFDKQPNEYWSSFYPERNLVAYTIQPSVITPTHYTGEPSHVSDTENTQVINAELFEPNKEDAEKAQSSLKLESTQELKVHIDL